MNVLLVEDDEVIAKTLEGALRSRGHACEVVRSGRQAVALAKHNDYDIVVLDFGLPDMDGFDVIRHMKLENIETPVLLQSGQADPGMNAQGAELGVDEFLAKPFSINELIQHMDTIVGGSGETHQRNLEGSLEFLKEQAVVPDSPASPTAAPSQPAISEAEQRRRHERRPLIGAALILDSNNRPTPCVILDISESGGALKLMDSDQDCPTLFTLETVDTKEQWRCELRWRREDKLGVEFQKTSETG